MSDTIDEVQSTAEGSSSALNDSAVAEYLAKHPGFFTDKAELLLTMIIPHESGNAISLLERQVNLLRGQNTDRQKNINSFIANAKANDELFEKIRIIIIALLKTSSLNELSSLIDKDLKENFSASISKLVFVTDSAVETAEVTDSNNLSKISLRATQKALGEQFGRTRSFCGSLVAMQAQLLFPETDTDIVSAAIIPIHLAESTVANVMPGTPLLLIGSDKENHFHSDLDTLFLDFFGEVLSAHLSTIK